MLTINEKKRKIKAVFLRYELPFFMIILLISSTGIAFGLGQLSSINTERTPVKIEYLEPEQSSQLLENLEVSSEGKVLASKNGTRYYYPWCGGVSRINPENIIWFEDREQAELAGYQPAANCQGM